MGKKLLCLIMAMCCIFALASCGEKAITMDHAGTDNTLHGGFVAETNGYVYFINGIESYSTSYKPGEVTKGALMRVSKSNLKATPETVVSKLLVAGDTDAGFYIFGDYVYYAVSSTEKDKTGNVKMDQLNFFRTKLDATETSKGNIADRDFPNSVTYRYMSVGGKVYLVVYSTDLFVYDAENGGLVYTTEVNPEDKKYKKDEEQLKADKLAKIDISEVLFTENAVYFTSYPINKLLSNADNIQKEAYQVVYKLNFAGKKADKIIDGAGTTRVDGTTNETGFGILGVTLDLLRVENETLYFTYTSLNTVEGGQAVYMAIPEEELSGIATTWHTNEEFVYSNTTVYTSTLFSTTTLFHGGKAYFVNANIGLLVYDHTKKDSADTDGGVTVLLSAEVLKSATLDFVNVEEGVPYLYFHDAAGIYYKVDITQDADTAKIVNSTILRINEYAINTAWYKPEVVKSGSKYYLLAVYSGAEFKSYVYAIDLANALDVEDEAWEEENELESNADFKVFAANYGILGVVADKDAQPATAA